MLYFLNISICSLNVLVDVMSSDLIIKIEAQQNFSFWSSRKKKIQREERIIPGEEQQ